MSVQSVSARTTAYLTVRFLDKNGVAASPAGISYRIDCMTSGQEIRDDTPIDPQAILEITIKASENAMINGTNTKERRRVTVVATYGEDDEAVGTFFYFVVQ